MRRLLFLLLFLLICSTPSFGAPKQVTVGVVTDGPSFRMDKVISFINEEIQLLTKNEFDVRLKKSKRLDGGWQRNGIESALSRLYKDPEVDIVIALGFGSAAVAVSLEDHPKPTLASVILNHHLVNAPNKGNSSGKHNLAYISIQADLATELKTFREVVDFTNIALLSDSLMMEVMPALATEGTKVATETGIKIFPVLHGGTGDDLVSRLPSDIDAVLIGALPRLDEAQTAKLLNKLIELGLPSYSLTGSHLVEQGALATAVPSENWQRRTRRLALDLQAVLFGDDPKDMKVFVEDRRRLILNMETARRLRISPPFDVMLEAQKLNDEPESATVRWTLSEAAKRALLENLGIRASKLGVEAGAKQVDEARANLFPQLSIGVDQQLRDDSNPSVVSGGIAEKQGTASLTLSQVIYNESTWANLDIVQAQQTARIAEDNQTKLDVIQDAAIAFLDVLKSQTLMKIRRVNLEQSRTNLGLARDRAKVGSATFADVYRWESELAQAKADLLGTEATLRQNQESLNRLLNRPLAEQFTLEPATLQDENLIMNDPELSGLIENRADFQRLSKILIQDGLDRSPEIASLLAKIIAQKRTLKSEKRSFWLPTITLAGEYSNTYHDSRPDFLSQEGKDDWLLGVNLSLPLFEGGARSRRVERAQLTLRQLCVQLQDTTNTIEQTIRGRLHTTHASKLSIDLNRTAAEASKKNFDLILDGYSKGTTGVVDLVDAQKSALTAELTAANAAWQFLIDLMNLQRATGAFDFFLDDTQRSAAVQAIKNNLSSGE
ncbi:MAG: TolC family protein [Desulfobacteraceae bacterium]|nr:TolC family protein [Desulfobacteraceae bacterium]MBC2756209.1 TolC family protein [Desulfobacteraceae bacterium]